MKKLLCVFLALFTLALTGCGGRKEVYSGEGYEFAYDPDKWELTAVSANGFTSFKSKDYDGVHLDVHSYVPEEEINLEERLERLKESGKAIGCVHDSGEIFDIDGREWCREEHHQDLGENTYKYVNFLTYSGEYAYIIGFTSDIDSFDKCMKEFEEIFDSFKFTE